MRASLECPAFKWLKQNEIHLAYKRLSFRPMKWSHVDPYFPKVLSKWIFALCFMVMCLQRWMHVSPQMIKSLLKPSLQRPSTSGKTWLHCSRSLLLSTVKNPDRCVWKHKGEKWGGGPDWLETLATEGQFSSHSWEFIRLPFCFLNSKLGAAEGSYEETPMSIWKRNFICIS